MPSAAALRTTVTIAAQNPSRQTDALRVAPSGRLAIVPAPFPYGLVRRRGSPSVDMSVDRSGRV
jgi:hypothetical protein